MPNWCDVSYVFEGPKEDIYQFQKNLIKCTSLEALPNDFGKNWEGNVAFGFGLDYGKFCCRGEIETIYEIQKGKNGFDWFSVDCFDAWEPNHELIDAIIDKFYPSITYELMAEEPGCEVFINTDEEGKYFPYRYRIVLDRGDEELIEKRCENIEKVNEFLASLTSQNPHLKNLDQVEDYLNEKFEWGHIWEYASE